MNAISAVAIAMKQTKHPEFVDYQKQVGGAIFYSDTMLFVVCWLYD